MHDSLFPIFPFFPFPTAPSASRAFHTYRRSYVYILSCRGWRIYILNHQDTSVTILTDDLSTTLQDPRLSPYQIAHRPKGINFHVIHRQYLDASEVQLLLYPAHHFIIFKGWSLINLPSPSSSASAPAGAFFNEGCGPERPSSSSADPALLRRELSQTCLPDWRVSWRNWCVTGDITVHLWIGSL